MRRVLQSLRRVPVLARAHVDDERRIERVGAGHLLAHEVPYRGHLLLGRLEQELVVYLEDEPGGAALVAQPPGDPHHGHLDHVGGGALHDRVHGEPLAQGARLAVRGSQLRDRSAATEQGANEAVPLGLLDRSGDEVLHVREAGEVGVDVGLGLLARNVQLVGEPERGDAVDDPEVDGLRLAPLVLRQRGLVLAEHLGCRRGVDVVAARERLAQLRLARDVGEDAQLDLRVVGGDEPASRLGDERAADRAAELRADRDRLEVRVGRREAARRRHRLVEGRVQPAVVADERRQRPEVRVEQLRVLAPLFDHRHDRDASVAQAPQHARVGRVARLALATGLEPERLEQDPGDLLGRPEQERLAGQLLRARLELLDLVGEAGRDLAHPVRVDLDARVLHRPQDERERQLDVAIQRDEVERLEPLAQGSDERQRRRRPADERLGLRLGRWVRLRLEPVLGREVVEEVARAVRVDEVRGDLRVVRRLEAGAPQLAGQRAARVHDQPVAVAQRGGEAVQLAGDDHGGVELGDRDAAVCRDDGGHAPDLGRAPLDPRRLEPGYGHLLGGGERSVELVDSPQEVAELEAPEDLLHGRAVGRREHELRGVAVDVEVAPHGREQLRGPRLVAVLLEGLRAGRSQLVDVVEHVLQRPEAGDELAGRLVADAGNARDVVGGVALEADEVRHLLGRDAVAGLDALGRVDVHVCHAARRHHQADVVRAELERVAVGGHDARADAGLVGARRDRGDDVVGLPALELEVAIAEGLDDRPEVRELLAQQVRHRPALALVLLRHLEPMGGPGIPRDCDALRLVVDQQLEQHVDEPEQRVRRESLRRRELLRQREERAVGEVVPVDEEEPRLTRRSVVELELRSLGGLRHDPSLRTASPACGRPPRALGQAAQLPGARVQATVFAAKGIFSTSTPSGQVTIVSDRSRASATYAPSGDQATQRAP